MSPTAAPSAAPTTASSGAPTTAPTTPPVRDEFERTWRDQRGLVGWLMEVNNQPLGLRFMLTSLVFFLLGGVMALVLRLQLAVPGNDLVGPQVFNELFSMHGSTMMYLFVVPFLEGLTVYLLPAMIGSRDLAFPRLSAFSYWAYLFGGLLFYSSFLVGLVPDAGWFAYTPLSGPRYSGLGVDLWLVGLSLVEVAGITAGAEIVVTILKLRAPGMSLARMPLFVWAMLVTGGMILVAFTVLLTATVLLELDRAAGTAFFDPDRGGSSLLWQHLFWFFGHPEVYISFLPATGIVSMIVATSARRAVAASWLVVVAIVTTGFLSFGLWAHHMFAAGLPELAQAFFGAASLMIAVASGVQVFAWIATLWGARPARVETPLLFVLGFLVLFVLGGMTGVMVAVVPFDLQVHDTYFVVAHFHYVLFGGVVFPIFAGIAYWLPKAAGRLLDARAGRVSFWLIFAGFNLTFFPMHVMGLLGLPRRVYTYPAELGLGLHNLVATGGSFLLALGVAAFFGAVAHALRRGQPAGDDPWGGEALEWSVPSPLPPYTHRRPPIVRGGQPMWGRPGPHALTGAPGEAAALALDGRPIGWRATLSTDPLTGAPQAIQWLSGPTIEPFVAAVGLLLAGVGMVAKLYPLALLGALLWAGATARWLLPDDARLEVVRGDPCGPTAGLPVLASGAASTAWWGALALVVVLGTALAGLLFTFCYLRLFSTSWPQGGLPAPAADLALGAAGALLLAAGALLAAGRALREGRRRRLGLLLGLAALGASAGAGLMIADVARLPFARGANAYASAVHTIGATVALYAAVAAAVTVAALVRLPSSGAPRDDGFDALQLQVTRMLGCFAAGASLAAVAVVHGGQVLP